MKKFHPPKRRGKSQKGRIGGQSSNQSQSWFGRYGIKALECKRITPSTIEAVRRTLTRFVKRNGQIWVCIFPDISVTKKPLEMRMGKGKGAISDWVFRIKAGQNLFEMQGVSESRAKQAVLQASTRLPLKTRFCVIDT